MGKSVFHELAQRLHEDFRPVAKNAWPHAKGTRLESDFLNAVRQMASAEPLGRSASVTEFIRALTALNKGVEGERRARLRHILGLIGGIEETQAVDSSSRIDPYTGKRRSWKDKPDKR